MASQDPLQEQPPAFACDGVVPRAWGAMCTGCHGAPSAKIPELHGYADGEASFMKQLRSGGDGMPAFPATTLSDADARAIYAYLQGSAAKGDQLGNVQPLFADSEVTPITFTRDDGVLVTRGAGRVRGRHELEGSYGPFHELYFEDRTYGFIVEDFTVKGESKVKVSYLPVARPTDMTNFRAFKIYGNGNVFHSNTGMDQDTALPGVVADYATKIAPYARVQSHVMTNNARSGKPLQKGDLFEFEFGVFIDKAAVRDNSRTAYYTDTFRYRVGIGGMTPENADTSGKLGPYADALLGGATTIAWAYAEPELSLEQMADNIQHEHVQEFVEGRRLFHTNFDTGVHTEPGNPVFTEQAKKRGPLYVSSACVSCHEHNGGGSTLSGTLDEKSSMTFKLYEGSLGNQLQLGEGSAKSAASEGKTVKLGDGREVKLSRPHFEVADQGGSALRSSARIARRLVGLGLLEALDERTLLSAADPDDCDGDGISGRPQLLNDLEGTPRIGRFGWRAEKVGIEHQVADALDADLGVGTSLIPDHGKVELNDEDVARLTAYMSLLGVPPQRDAADAQVKAGEQVFLQVGCASCHLPALTTGHTHPFVELRGQAIRPYSDLLLHDLGPDLQDDTGASEWRTAPLWGNGLSQTVQGHVSLLHDGRAASVLAAVLWHGGEAEAVKERVIALPSDQREALLRFVESL